jgi:hypothetical protein
MSQAAPTDSLPPGSLYTSVSQADAPDSTIKVFISPTPRSLKGAVTLGTIQAPPVSQNNLEQLTAALTLPSRPGGFQGPGGKFYVWFLANAANSFPEATHVNGLSKQAVPVQITSQPLPEIRAIGLNVPARMQPGDTIAPVIVLENFGTADTSLQAPVTVELVASVTRSFTLGSSIVGTYTVNNIPAVSETPTKGNYKTFAKRILTPPQNVVAINSAAVTLPTSPSRYYLGVVVDPQGKINQLSLPANSFQVIHVVGPRIPHLPPAGVVSSPNTEQFPTAAGSQSVGVPLTS